jgi:hypothetical protein
MFVLQIYIAECRFIITANTILNGTHCITPQRKIIIDYHHFFIAFFVFAPMWDQTAAPLGGLMTP